MTELRAWADRVVGDAAVPDVRQQTDYTCGPSVLAAVLRYFGRAVPEVTLAAEAGTTPEDGTMFDAMARVLRAHGLTVEPSSTLDPATIKRLLADGALVVIALQAWDPELPPLGGYAAEWNSGHYVVPVAVDDEAVLFEDPAVAGRRAFLTFEEFGQRWHDVDAGGVYPRGFGLIVRGTGPVVWRRRVGRLAPPVRMG
jgi:hypothetical protein